MRVEYVRVGDAVQRRVWEVCLDCCQDFTVTDHQQRRCPSCQRAYVRAYNTAKVREYRARRKAMAHPTHVKPERGCQPCQSLVDEVVREFIATT
jgi:hypothetical protein